MGEENWIATNVKFVSACGMCQKNKYVVNVMDLCWYVKTRNKVEPFFFFWKKHVFLTVFLQVQRKVLEKEMTDLGLDMTNKDDVSFC